MDSFDTRTKRQPMVEEELVPKNSTQKMMDTVATQGLPNTMPAARAFKKLGLHPNPQMMEMWDQLSPEQRDLMLEEIVISDGMATPESIMNHINGK